LKEWRWLSVLLIPMALTRLLIVEKTWSIRVAL
jgi:hypothetical protein